ncbi:hypothetical protein KSF78_0009126 [Schistosoma japonicum]|nr:hypothetical protein KSF78_0009126 [Schistosoma japonicum]
MSKSSSKSSRNENGNGVVINNETITSKVTTSLTPLDQTPILMDTHLTPLSSPTHSIVSHQSLTTIESNNPSNSPKSNFSPELIPTSLYSMTSCTTPSQSSPLLSALLLPGLNQETFLGHDTSSTVVINSYSNPTHINNTLGSGDELYEMLTSTIPTINNNNDESSKKLDIEMMSSEDCEINQMMKSDENITESNPVTELFIEKSSSTSIINDGSSYASTMNDKMHNNDTSTTIYN